ncbi:hypothetical protein QBC46DRAFT_390211 [Diplogelasinospora grovesii]|uniref:Uncharacterized protein n=1 Tax=Diplogelasinospora grovesii TaxID=303347 RepID=A0AAN6N5Z6_9PEZI|nr:hypothetical protein QBC46DRAFT_390211 [Diplogelasinospora grovesii]
MTMALPIPPLLPLYVECRCLRRFADTCSRFRSSLEGPPTIAARNRPAGSLADRLVSCQYSSEPKTKVVQNVGNSCRVIDRSVRLQREKTARKTGDAGRGGRRTISRMNGHKTWNGKLGVWQPEQRLGTKRSFQLFNSSRESRPRIHPGNQAFRCPLSVVLDRCSLFMCCSSFVSVISPEIQCADVPRYDRSQLLSSSCCCCCAVVYVLHG